jgi:hypothetical protein
MSGWNQFRRARGLRRANDDDLRRHVSRRSSPRDHDHRPRRAGFDRVSPVPRTSFTARVGLHLKPGQKGTKQLLARYGDRLICVRYGYDAERKKRFKPVELPSRNAIGNRQRPRFAHDQIVGLRVAFTDVAGRDRVKQAGGTWNPERRVWQLRYDRVVALGLKSPIVDEPASNTGCPPSRGEHLHSRCPDSIQIEMLASTIGCRHPTADATVCRRIVVSWRSG